MLNDRRLKLLARESIVVELQQESMIKKKKKSITEFLYIFTRIAFLWYLKKRCFSITLM